MAPRQRIRPGEAKLRPAQHKPCGKLVVCIRERPRDYAPNSGPPCGDITLLPAGDSTAYITERILLPPSKGSGGGRPGPRRMSYIVGWHDLPAARLLVPVVDILDYVSPRELEAWETALEEELSAERAERAKAAEAKVEAEKSEGAIPTAAAATTAAAAPVPKGKRKRKKGKPPAHAQIESAVVTGLETDEKGAKGRLKGGTLTLSTPPKYRIKELESLSDDDGDDRDEVTSPTHQLIGDMYDEAMGRESNQPEDAAHGNGLDGDDIPPRTTGGLAPVRKETASSATAPPTPRPSWVTAGSAPSSSRKTAPWPPWPPSSKPTSTADLTPAPPKKRSSPSQSRAPDESTSGTKKSSDKKKTKKGKQATPKPKKNKDPEPAPDGEPEWIVERIENDALFEVDGQDDPVRFFQVRWEGDWPPDQNPTWEPEENLPPNLIRNYLKTGKAKRKQPPGTAEDGGSNKKPKLKQSKLSWLGVEKSRYGSVSEAFAGEENDLLENEKDDDGDGDEEEEFLVV
ncbi:Chromo (CHRromatin Organization MOdifier) domain [Geosmithia morbida]|uniref:Chromo (CHRromatin Organization MOdifier) domain n=1 Tax=Geosmithia morbida TaxID=1094350 RepID=A0A9P4Z3W0_9HYPO|nr:Chromo (CHRromatin Organization MOdifier) domain [Geosmithia morbida]KAF4126982.1 Chromo (CHRromatin Organization MOdifier) domain [Geosmithia morbida]